MKNRPLLLPLSRSIFPTVLLAIFFTTLGCRASQPVASDAQGVVVDSPYSGWNEVYWIKDATSLFGKLGEGKAYYCDTSVYGFREDVEKKCKFRGSFDGQTFLDNLKAIYTSKYASGGRLSSDDQKAFGGVQSSLVLNIVYRYASTGQHAVESGSAAEIAAERRFRSLLSSAFDAAKGTSSGSTSSGGATSSGGPTTTSSSRVTQADVDAAIRTNRSTYSAYNLDSGAVSRCKTSGAGAGWSSNMQNYYCSFPGGSGNSKYGPQIRECFTGAVTGGLPGQTSKMTYAQGYEYCSTDSRSGTPMSDVRRSQDRIFRAVMIDRSI